MIDGARAFLKAVNKVVDNVVLFVAYIAISAGLAAILHILFAPIIEHLL